MKHLFKLKKDGKTVGYAEFQKRGNKDKIRSNDLIVRYSRDKKTWDGSLGVMLQYDEILPYVTDDKNGDLVFAGDKCHIKYDISSPSAYKSNYKESIATILYDNERLLYYWAIDDHYKTIIDFQDYETDIELLKDDEK